MAVDFKPPKKYLFDHYIRTVLDLATGIQTTDQQVSDELRLLLNLIYDQEFIPPPTAGFAALVSTPLQEIFEKYLQLNLSQQKFEITPAVNLTEIPPADQKKLLDFLLQFEKDNAPTGLAAIKKVYEDFNFRPENEEGIGLAVQVVTRRLNSLDIKQGDDYFTSGDLAPDKDETSLKFAYAFKTTSLQGEFDVISKQVALTPDAVDIQKFARNQNDNIKKIDRLKNLIYFGSESDTIEKAVIEEGSQQDIGIDKVYNLLTIDLPKQQVSALNDFNSIWPYITNNKTPLINQMSFPPLDNLNDLVPFIDDYYKYLCISYFIKLLDAGNKFNDIRDLTTIVPGNDKQFSITSYGLGKQEAENFSKNFSLDLRKKALQDLLFTSEFPKTNELVKDLVFEGNGIFSDIVNLITATNQGTILGVNALSQIYALGSSISAFYDSISLFVDDKFKKPLLNYSMSEVFSGAFKTSDKFVFKKGAVQDNLLRKGKLIGLRLVKSLTPLDPDGQAAPSNILQVYHIPVQLTPQNQQIRLFDSQIVYGQDYFYTIYGVYSVDGKYYYYDDIQKAVKDLPAGEKETVVDVFENKQFENTDESATKNAISELKLIGIDEANDKNAARVYFNPCCQYRDSKFVNVGSTTGTGKGSNPNDSFWGVSSPTWSKPGFAEELEKRIEDLVSAAKAGSSSKTNELNSAIKKLKASPYYEGISCWTCQRRSEGGNASILAFLLSEFNDGQDKLLLNALNCKKYGYSKAEGNVTNSSIANDSLLVAAGLGKFVIPGTITKQKCTKEEKVKVGTKKVVEKVTTQAIEKFSFNLKESNATRIFDVPLQPSVESTVIDVPPLDPVVTFVPLANVNDRIKIKFQEAVQSDYAIIKIDEAILSFNNTKIGLKQIPLFAAIVLKSQEIAKDEGIILPKDSILARSQGDLSEIHVRKLDRRPNNLQDLIDNGEEFVLDFLNGKTAYFSNLKPNQKYYYTFVSRDIAGLYSRASATFVVEVVEDSGFVYAATSVYEYPVEENKVTSKHFQKLLKIAPSFEELLPIDAQRLGTDDLYSTVAGSGNSTQAGKPPKFKIRVRSKKTKRAFDINLKYTQDVKEVTSKRLLKQIKKFSELVDKKVETN